MSIFSLHVSTLELKAMTLVNLVSERMNYKCHFFELYAFIILTSTLVLIYSQGHNLQFSRIFDFCRYNVLVPAFELNVTTLVKVVNYKGHVISRAD